MRKLLVLLIPLVLVVACNGTPTVTPCVTPDEVGVRETGVARLEATVIAATERLSGFGGDEVDAVQSEGISAGTQARWLSWMYDPRTPVFWFWRDPSSGKWVAVCHIVPRPWSSQYKAWHESAVSLEDALVKVLGAMDADGDLR
ncbi:MAG TPA: hypothetical protein VMY98_04035 [Anaerolineae bacterium]|nr:hypothetical protein [Anaerolineae bacterium]